MGFDSKLDKIRWRSVLADTAAMAEGPVTEKPLTAISNVERGPSKRKGSRLEREKGREKEERRQ